MLTDNARSFVEQLFKDKLSPVFQYHNLQHTVYTVHWAQKIAKAEHLDGEALEQVLLASWFHDTGYIDGAENHEDHSVAIMSEFLHGQGKSDAYIAQVARLILSTKMGYEPATLPEKILKDADCAHFGDEDYKKISDRLREEWSLTGYRTFSDKKWNRENLLMLKDVHQYYTAYAQAYLEPVKQENIKKIKKKIEKQEEIEKIVKNELDKPEKEKEPKTDRSVDTMFRVTLNNHTRLSDIADSKANILLSVSAIIISVCLSTLVPKLDAATNAHLIFPTFMLLFFSVITIIFAILSTKPNITKNRFTIQDVQERRVNLVFFGNFNQLPLEEFLPSMRTLLADKDYVYDTMLKDLYSLGKVLDRKYKLLRITYYIFMAGIVLSAVSFAYAFWRL